MPRPDRWIRVAAVPFAAAGIAALAWGVGRGAPTPGRIASPGAAESAHGGEAFAATLAPDPELAPDNESLILAHRKRIMGRLRSLQYVRRVATQVRPLVERALEQSAVQDDLRVLARQAGMSLAEYKLYFAGKHEADLLLESGGDPNARSSANALGVAQYLASTGRRCGLRIDEGASNRLSRQIGALEEQIASLQEQPAEWTQVIPAALRGITPTYPASVRADSPQLPARPAPLPGQPAGVWSRDQWIAYRLAQREQLFAARRRVDERFDPAKAMTVQSRYLVGLTRRYGGVDWALQAYHGGEAGVSRTLRLFRSASPILTLASRGAPRKFGQTLTYTELYRHVTPTGTPEAFSYLFGRSDDHRYYWWKVLMAERALDLYRKDSREFERQWRALQPGMSADAAFYPDPAPLQFAGSDSLRAAYRQGTLVPLPARAVALGVRTENVAALDPAAAGLHKGLRPEAMGALLRLAHVYRSFGGGSPLTLASMVQSSAYRQLWDARYPAPPLPPDVPRDPEFHTTGLAFDLRRPARDWDRKVLEFALGRLYDGLRVSWRKESGGDGPRYHVVVNPAHKAELAAYYARVAKG